MEKEMLKELNDLRKELEIPKEVFVSVLKEVLNIQMKSKGIINDEQAVEFIKELLLNYDNKLEYDSSDNYEFKTKNAHETLRKVLRNYY